MAPTGLRRLSEEDLEKTFYAEEHGKLRRPEDLQSHEQNPATPLGRRSDHMRLQEVNDEESEKHTNGTLTQHNGSNKILERPRKADVLLDVIEQPPKGNTDRDG